jgi:UDP-2,3-diacylglucosamine hydrolase
MKDTIYFISDAHLGSQNLKKEKLKEEKFFSFLERVKKEGEHLYIVGDLFEFWFEYKKAIPKEHFSVLAELRKLIDQGIKINYLPGNHDFWLGDFFAKEVGIKILHEFTEVTHQSKRIFITHGDGLAKNDWGYRVLKRILRNRVNIWLYRKIPPDLGIPLAKLVAQSSRDYTDKREDDFLEDYRVFAQDKIKQGFDAVIMGHTHHPEIMNYENGVYLNLGDWFKNFSFGKLKEGRFYLETLG